MKSIISAIEKNKVDYDSVIRESEFCINWYGDCRFSVIVPVRGRERFLPVLIDSFIKTGYKDYCITVVEHSDIPTHKVNCSGINYIHIPAKGKPFNKCLSFNIGVIASCCGDYYIFHDLDCLVQKSFFDNLISVIEKNDAELVQPFKDRRILFCTESLTNVIISGGVDVNELHLEYEGMLPSIPSHIGAPGGSMMVSRDLFFAVGGYDPELFWLYAPEDAFFLVKLLIFAELFTVQNSDIFHMWHPLTTHSNPDLKSQINIWKLFMSLPLENREAIVEHKRKLIEKYT